MMKVTITDKQWDRHEFIGFDVQMTDSAAGPAIMMFDTDNKPWLVYAPGSWHLFKVQHDYEPQSESPPSPSFSPPSPLPLPRT
jgi:hypothetical protein